MDRNEQIKKYEEALRKAKEYYANVPGSREFLDNIFPQLSESEDENIRKEIIEYFHGCIRRNKKSGFRVEQIKGWIAYLEKQKEQKPIKTLCIPKFWKSDMVVSTNNPRLTYRILDVGNINKLGNPEYKVEIFTDGKSDESRNIRYIEVAKMDDWGKLIEQQPAEWSDSVAKEMFIKALERAVEQTKNGYELTDCDKHSWWEDFKAYSGIKPTEWSEEDKKMIECLIRHTQKEYDELCKDSFGHQEIISDLKESCRERMNWLDKLRKSLRPSWKPSELQMFALDNAILMAYNLKRGGDKEELQSLYNDLEKLRKGEVV